MIGALPARARATELRGHDRAALLAHELLHVVGTEPALAGRAAALPPAERLDPRPRAGGRAGAPVDVDHAGLDLVEEPCDLVLVAAEDARREAVVDRVRLGQRLVERADARHGHVRDEQLLAREAMPGPQSGDDRRLHVVAREVGPAAAGGDGAVAPRLLDGGGVALDGAR